MTRSSGGLDWVPPELARLKDALDLERRRTDFLVAAYEGGFEGRERLAAARKEAEFSVPFDRATPLVSVCVATVDRSSLLIERCIRSLLRQTYKNLQIVVIGDHCTDDTAYRLAKLRDSRILFENLPQRGPYPAPGFDRWCVAGTMAVNRAIDLAEGDFICHLDDDDEADRTRIEVMVEAARRARGEFLWHRFLTETANGQWLTLGEADLRLGQVTTGSIFYHRYFRVFKWDPLSYRWQEPGDWNRIRKIKFVQPKLVFVDQALTIHYREGQQPAFVPQHGETFVI